jgi:GSH-dependent disulfide-bond oxidoreductase
MASIELYACMTPNVLKVMFMLGELELDFDLHHVRIYRGENFADGFEALHPYRELPVLIDHDGPNGTSHRVFESGAILFYLAEKTGRLFGENATERSDVMQWLMLQMSSVGPAFGNAAHFNRAAGSGNEYARDRFVTQAVRLCRLYDERLVETRFLAGEEFTIADVATFPWLWRHPTMLGIDMAAFPNLTRWIAEIRERPGLLNIHGRYREIVRIDMEDMAAADPDMMDRFLGRGAWTLT